MELTSLQLQLRPLQPHDRRLEMIPALHTQSCARRFFA